MSAPMVYVADEIKNWPCAAQIDGKYVCARPEGFYGLCLGWRIKLAWRVFTGKYDALEWVKQ